MSFKWCAFLSSTMKPQAVWPHPAQDVNHPFVQRLHTVCYLPTHHLVAVSVIGLTVVVLQGLLNNGPKGQERDAGNSEMPKRIC